jgi:enoyl-CoA hydratase
MAIDLERRDDGIAVITINRPEALNAFTSADLGTLLATVKETGADRSIRVVILTGAGERSFVAGADIKEMANKSTEEGRQFGVLGHSVANALEAIPQPVIAAVNGFAFGGGCELALASQIRIASENAQFAQPEVSLGIPPGWGGSQRLPRLIGPGLAAEMIFTARRVKADEALRIGLVNAVYSIAELMPQVIALAGQIAKNSPRAVAASKQLIRRSLDGNVARGLEAEIEALAQAFGSDDQREGMTAFVEKRPAVFTGN